MMIECHRIYRAHHGRDGCFDVSPEGLCIVRHAGNVTAGVITEHAIADPDDIAERVLIEMAVFDGINGDVLLGLLGAAGPDHPAGSYVPDVEVGELFGP